MADQQPGEDVPAAGLPPAAPTGAARPADPTRAEHPGPPAGDGDASTVDAPVRWSGSAAVPPPAPKKARWGRRAEDEPSPVATPPVREPDPTTVDPEDWASMPAVDPWADQDTPWDLGVPIPEPLPPTRVEQPQPQPQPPARAPQPPTRAEQPASPTRAEQPVPPTRVDRPASPAPGPKAPAGTLPPAAAPPAAPAPKRRRWGRDKAAAVPAKAVTRPPTMPAPTISRPPARPTPARPPVPPPPGPPRRKRRWTRNIAMFSLLSALCCCGVPAYYAWPAARQYPVTAALPDTIADLSLRDDGASRRAVTRLTQQLKDADSSIGDVFAGVYGDNNGKKVTVVGSTGLRITPAADVDTELQHLTSEYDVRDVQPFDLGEAGAHESCGVGDTGGTSVVVCTWADHGSLATVLLTRRSVEDSAELVGVLRSAVLTRG